VLWHIGNFHAALEHLLEAYARYDEGTHAQLAAVYGQDFGVWTLSYLEHAQLSLGYPEKGSRAIKEALALARRLNHPLSLCNALIFNALSGIRRDDPVSVLTFTEESLKVAGEQGFPQYIALSSFDRGWALAKLGAIDEGIELTQKGIDMWYALGAAVSLAEILGGLAQSQLIAGQAQAALETTDVALTWIERNTESSCESTVHCVRGDAFSALGDPERGRVEYETAIFVARSQDARWLEMQAVVNLARLLHQQGKTAEARNLLAPVYGWFTEGFDTPVLKVAKALLDDLGGPSVTSAEPV
jgi:tetratricopeptide (TPR) repeat protein